MTGAPCLCDVCTIERREAALVASTRTQHDTFVFFTDSAGTLDRQALSPASDGSDQEGDLKHGEDYNAAAQ